MGGVSDLDSGVLARIPAQYVGAAMDQMPDPDTARGKTAATELTVPQLGRVRITFVLKRDARRGAHHVWSVVRADVVS